MPALTCELSQIKISYTSEGITFYPKEVATTPVVTLEMALFAMLLGGYFLPGGVGFPHLVSDKLEACISRIIAGKLFDFVRPIRREDDDHSFYHRDTFEHEEAHYHLKLKKIINRASFVGILDIFIENTLISPAEKEIFLNCFDTRYAGFRGALAARLSHVKATDLPIILETIAACADSDLLVDLHRHLLCVELDYLRAKTGIGLVSFWRGTDRSDAVVSTSRSWATIEKAIMLKMAKNTKDECTRFSAPLAAERSRELTEAHRFFAIKRYELFPSAGGNASFDAFSHADAATVDRKYMECFARVAGPRA